MQELTNSLIDTTAQCWACGVFDALFAIISTVAAAAYERLTIFGVIIFCILFVFYVFNAFWQNMKSGMGDPMFHKSLRPVLIKSMLALSLLAMGTTIPKLISKITFEPVAAVTLQYSKVMLPDDYKITETPTKISLDNNGFFNPKLRDTILQIVETSVSNFQVYIKIGVAIINSAFSIDALLGGIGAMMRHIIIFFLGLFLTYNFAKLFIKYSFCFMDIIVAMAMFAFFFPLSLIFFIFKGASDAPKWMQNLGGSLGGGQIKKLINSIVSVASAILTYTIIMQIIRGFLEQNHTNTNFLQQTSAELFNFNLDNPDTLTITFSGIIVLVYVINYIADQVPKITEKIMSVFGLKQENEYSDAMGKNMLRLTEDVWNLGKSLATTVITHGAATAEKADDKKESKKPEEKTDDKK